MMRRVLALVRADLRNALRDPLLLVSLALPFILALAFRLGLPAAGELAARWLGADLRPHHPFLAAMLLLSSPLTLGTLAGFVMLDERDENVLGYFAVTPLAKSGSLLHRTLAPIALSFLFSLIVVPLAGLPQPRPSVLIPVALLAAVEATQMALFMGAFADNEVEGLALSKLAGGVMIGPLAGYLAPPPWHWAGGLLPPFWVTQAYLAGYHSNGRFWLYLGGGALVHALILGWLWRRFDRRVG
ncbi:MAG: ABC transporter permease [bacterium]|nr:ABC transporter permease [bacterium]